MKISAFCSAIAAVLLVVLSVGCSQHAGINAPNEHMRLGEAAMQRHDWNAAVPQLQLAVAADNRNWQAHRDLGNAYSELGDTTSAQEQFREAHRLNPRLSPPRTGIPVIY